jgi:hypothetical protein
VKSASFDKATPPMWGLSIKFWQSVVLWANIAALVAAVVTGAALFVSAWVSSSIADIIQEDADRRITEARTKGDEAEARAAEATQRAAEARERTAIAEERLLNERRLTAIERWRLERIERAVLPRSLFVDWPKLLAELKAGHFQPTNLAYVDKPEPRDFAINLMMVMRQAGVLDKFISLPGDSATSSSGGLMIVATPDGDRLAEMLWQKFQIGGGSMSAAALPAVWSAIPKNANCLVIEENNWAMSPSSGRPGEGIDKYGGPDPAPH